MAGPSLAPTESSRAHIPLRTCVGCRKREARSVLVRVVLEGDHLVVDSRGAAPGRGAWLHPGTDCLDIARKRKALQRALGAANSDASTLSL